MMRIVISNPGLRGLALAVAAGVVVLAGCATGPGANPADPIEPLNRSIFRLNEKLDNKVLQPVARAYGSVVPSPARTAVSNFFSNAGDVYSAANNLFQLKGAAALEDVMRVAINTVLGLGGLIDIASDAGLPKHKEDFGQTLGAWGMPAGPYVVWPLLGPSTMRDTAGFLVDWQSDPLTYWRHNSITYSLSALRVVDVRTRLLGASRVLEDAALDRYTFVRDVYLKRRRYLIYDGNPPEDQADRDAPAGAAQDDATSPYHYLTPNWPVFRR